MIKDKPLKKVANEVSEMLNDNDVVNSYIVVMTGAEHDCSSHVNGTAAKLMAMTCCIVEQIAEGDGSSIEHVLDTIRYALEQKEANKSKAGEFGIKKTTNQDLADKIAQAISRVLSDDDMED